MTLLSNSFSKSSVEHIGYLTAWLCSASKQHSVKDRILAANVVCKVVTFMTSAAWSTQRPAQVSA